MIVVATLLGLLNVTVNTAFVPSETVMLGMETVGGKSSGSSVIVAVPDVVVLDVFVDVTFPV